jgi:hypothetical protein
MEGTGELAAIGLRTREICYPGRLAARIALWLANSAYFGRNWLPNSRNMISWPAGRTNCTVARKLCPCSSQLTFKLRIEQCLELAPRLRLDGRQPRPQLVPGARHDVARRCTRIALLGRGHPQDCGQGERLYSHNSELEGLGPIRSHRRRSSSPEGRSLVRVYGETRKARAGD